MTHSDNSYDLNENDMTVGTDMMVNYLANSEKLRDEDERWYYSKNKNNNDDEVDDDFDSYKKSDNYNSRSEERDDRRDDRDYHDDRDDRDDKRSYDNHSEGESRSEKHGSSNDKYIDEEYENLSPLEKRLRRLDLMRKLGELRDLGCKVTNYSIDDDYYMMKYEHELHTSIRNKRNWMGLYNHMLIGGVKLIELGNDRYNPFDFSLKGLSNEVGADKTTYYEILGEIYEHYNVPGKKMNPWFRLAVNLIGTVALVGGKNNAHKFLPQQAKEVENDESMLENLRAKAMNSSQNAQAAKPTQNNLDEYMNKEHDKAAQRVKDLENLKHQELEFQRFQKMLAEDNNKFSNMKKQLEMSQQSPDSERMRRSQASSKSKSVSKSASRKKESTESDSRSTMTVTSTQSTQSTISVNKKLAAQLANKSSIKASSISFGSSNKGKKTSISIGNR